MARLYTSGFEVANDTAGHEWTNAGVSGAGRDTTTVRTGTGSGRCSGLVSATQAGWGVQHAAAAGNGPYYLRTYLRIATNPSADNCIIAFISGANVTSTSANDAQIRLSSTGTLKLFANNAQVGSASSALSTGTWYRIELEVDNGPGAGSKVIRGYLDGTQFAGTSSSSDVGGTVSGIALGGNLIAEAQTQGDWYFDDVAVNDSTGSFQTTLPGPGKVICLRPNAAGDSNQWNNTANGAGSSNNFQLVDETSPNDATDMVQSGTLNNLDLYNLEASGLSSTDTVNCVQVWFRRRNNTADATTAVNAVVIKTASGTQSNGTAVVPNTTTWRTGSSTTANVIAANHTSYQDPDGAAWTSSTLDSMQTGPKVTTANVNRIQVSAVWVTVDYNPPSTATPATIATVTATPAVSPSAGSTITPATLAAVAALPAVTAQASSTPTPAVLATATSLPAVTAVGGGKIGALVDNFNDNNIDTGLWPNNYGGVAETGGRFVIDCDAGQWSGLKSGESWTLDESQVTLRAYPAAANTATSAYLLTLVTTTTAGTAAGFNIDTASGGIAFLNWVGFSDPGAVFDTYSATDHAYLRLREASGTLHWETSADGQTWTSERTESSPAWVTDTTLALVVEAHRDAGTDNTAEVDDVNVISATPTPETLTTTTALPAVTATGNGDATATPATLTSVAALPAVTLSAGSTPTPATLAAPTTMPAVTAGAGQTAAPDVLAATTALPAVAVSAGSTPTPATLATATALPVVGLQAGQTAAPVTLAAVTALPAAAVSGGSTATPATIATVTSLPAAGASSIGEGTATPDVIETTTELPAVTGQAGSTVAAEPIGTVTTVPAVSLSAGATATPATLAAPTSLPDVSVSADSTPTPGPLAATFTFPALSPSAGSTVSLQVLQTLLSMPAVYVIAGIHRAITETTLTALNTSTPDVTAGRTATPATTGGRTSTAGVGARTSSPAVSASRTSTASVG